MGRWIDLTGQAFGNMEAIKYLGTKMWLVRCEHGITFPVRGAALRGGETVTCRMHCPFCPAGHDTRVVGRYRHHCAECSREKARMYARTHHAAALARARKHYARNTNAVLATHRRRYRALMATRVTQYIEENYGEVRA